MIALTGIHIRQASQPGGDVIPTTPDPNTAPHRLRMMLRRRSRHCLKLKSLAHLRRFFRINRMVKPTAADPGLVRYRLRATSFDCNPPTMRSGPETRPLTVSCARQSLEALPPLTRFPFVNSRRSWMKTSRSQDVTCRSAEIRWRRFSRPCNSRRSDRDLDVTGSDRWGRIRATGPDHPSSPRRCPIAADPLDTAMASADREGALRHFRAGLPTVRNRFSFKVSTATKQPTTPPISRSCW